jgi:rRNA maturation protein Nop10
VKECMPVPCPSFEEKTLDVEKCPTCGSPELKWSPTQVFSCSDEFHNDGLSTIDGEY